MTISSKIIIVLSFLLLVNANAAERNEQEQFIIENFSSLTDKEINGAYELITSRLVSRAYNNDAVAIELHQKVQQIKALIKKEKDEFENWKSGQDFNSEELETKLRANIDTIQKLKDLLKKTKAELSARSKD